MARKRISKKTLDVIQSLIFFTSTMAIISCLIMYLWVYTEIDETLLAIELQKATLDELNNSIKELQNDIVLLERVDRITETARKDLGMVFASPETISVYIEHGDLAMNK